MKKDKTKDKKSVTAWLPDREVKAIARCFLPTIREFYETEEGKNTFAKWECKEAEKERQTEEHRASGVAGKDGCDDGKE
jgi:hypothetical protein